MAESVTGPVLEQDKDFPAKSQDVSQPNTSLKISAIGEGLEVATVGQKATFEVHGTDKDQNECDVAIANLTCELVHANTNQVIHCSVKKGKKWLVSKKHCVISYTPTSFGRHHLHVKFKGVHISGSPFPVIVLRDYKLPKLIINDVTEPISMAVSQKGEFIIAHINRGHLTVCNQSGVKIKTIETELSCLQGIAMDSDNEHILVTSIKQPGVIKLNIDGDIVQRYSDFDKFKFQFATGISVHPVTKKIYIADCSRNQVVILDQDLSYFDSFGEYGEENGQLNSPRNVAFDNLGRLYVSDHNNSRIVTFSPDGQFQRQFGKSGWSEGELLTPKCVCLDPDDIVYVCEGGNHPRLRNHRISIFSTEGHFLKLFGSFGHTPGLFSEPHAVWVDKDKVVYVCDSTNNRIQVF